MPTTSTTKEDKRSMVAGVVGRGVCDAEKQ